MTPHTAPGILTIEPPTYDEIKKVVCEHYNITLDQFHSKTRKPQFAFPRQVAMYLARILRASKKETLETVGWKIAKKDHATVIHAVRCINNELFTNKNFKNELAAIKSKIKGEVVKP